MTTVLLPYPIAMAEHWMNQAYELALSAEKEDEVPVGAILVVGRDIIGFGANHRERTHRTAAHAEIVALDEYSRRTKEWRVPPGTSLFVTVEPCLMCTGALLWARVDNIFYGCADTRNAGMERILPLVHQGIYDHRFQETRGGILGDRCSHLMSGYFRAKRQARSADSAESPS